MTFSITQDLDALPRVANRHAASAQDVHAIVTAEAPAVIKGALDHWPALAAGRQPGERAYWKEMFDAYVFRARGDDAIAHIPAALQGTLGPMSPSFRARLKQQLKMAYLKS